MDNFTFRHGCAKFQQNQEGIPAKSPQARQPVSNLNHPTINAIRPNPQVPQPEMLPPVPFTPIVARPSGINVSTGYRNIQNGTYTRQRRVSF